MTIHHFDSTGQAYNACQCEAEINDGDILVIESEGVVGLAGTWPVAVTSAYGELHTPKDGDLQHVAEMFGFGPVQDAIVEADKLGLAMPGERTRKSDLLGRLARLNKAERRDPKDWRQSAGPGYLQRWERYREARWAIEAQLSKLP